VKDTGLKTYMALINDFSHDLFTGLWICCIGTMYIVRRRAAVLAPDPAVARFAADINATLHMAQNTALILVLATGILRYRHAVRDSSRNTGQRRALLLVKHLVLAFLAVAGTWLGHAWSG